MKNNNQIAPWVKRFLVEHVVIERNLSKNTQKSYRDTFALLLPFIAKQKSVPIENLEIEYFSIDAIRDFLTLLQETRGCSPVTCNQRLAAIHAFAKFVSWKSPEHVMWAGQARSVPFKKTTRTVVPYLERLEVDAILAAPNASTWLGLRDYVLLLLLYNTGARASEVANLTVGDLDLKHASSVKLLGKGDKVRYCPLWKQTVSALSRITQNRLPGEKLFLNRKKQPLTRFGIHTLVEKYFGEAKLRCNSLQGKRVSPHTFRHTTAVHLLRSGVDINTIRAWLGHVSIDTTNIYAEVDLEMKSKALALCQIGKSKLTSRNKSIWKESPDLMNYLRSL